MRKEYQNQEIDTSQPAVPDTVSVALSELAGELREGLLALAVGTGLQVMAAIMESDVTAACGPKGRHDPERRAVRHGRGAGSVSLGGRRVPVERPRMRAVDGSGELAVPAYELFSDTEVMGRMALDRMLAGLSTRHYGVGLEPVGARTEQAARATSRSAVSRRFVAQTQTALAELLTADLTSLDLVAFMVDGVHFGEHTCVVALGIDINGVKHPLSLVEGSTENATLVTELIVGLRERGLDVTRPVLAVLDGSKALRRAVLDVFDRPVIGPVNSTRSGTSKIISRRSYDPRSPPGCGGPITPTPHSPPRPSCARWPPNSTAPTPAPRRACAKAWPRPSPCCASTSRPRSRAPSARPTPSSR